MASIEKVIFELTTACNLRCPGCYMGERLNEETEAFTFSQFADILDLTKPSQIDLLGGEPTTWKPLRKGVVEARKRGIETYLFTNMTKITPSLARFLFENDVNVTGKLNIGDFSDPEQRAMQAKMIGRPERFVSLMEQGVNYLLKAGFKTLRFSIENLLRKENMPYAAAFIRWCAAREIRPDLELPACAGDAKDNYWDLMPSKQEIRDLIEETKDILGDKTIPPHITARCTYYDCALYFRPNGDIQPCSGNSTIVANVFRDENPIAKALANPLITLRRGLTQSAISEGYCARCDEWDACGGGCRATVENLGNPRGSYTPCWKVPEEKQNNR